MRSYAFFHNYANYALRVEICDFAAAYDSGSPVYGNKCSLTLTYQTSPRMPTGVKRDNDDVHDNENNRKCFYV